ncbi:MAG TPA: DNA polymerase Y family protein [Rhodocyclaceae bacterium]|nr:DNA polymerase Y family protein [Rhodocyclaceae bacterium]
MGRKTPRALAVQSQAWGAELGQKEVLTPVRVALEQSRAVAWDEAAAAAGVRRGMKSALVRSLLPAVVLLPRDPARELAVLEALACWAGSFTPQVKLWPGHGLLLEIGGCLRLFGGLPALLDRILSGLAEQGFRVVHAAAPTAQGAAWLTLAGADGLLVSKAKLAAVLDRLPLTALATELPARSVERLAGFGLGTLGEVRRLPSAALARRIGPESLTAMGRAYGEVADGRPAFVFPEHFALGLDLPADVEDASALLFAARRLVQALAGWLAVRQSGIRECRLRLSHRRMDATVLPLRFAEPLRDGERMAGVLRERLGRFELPAPVDALRLEADAVEALAGHNQPLFARVGASPEGMAALADRLRARLGEAQVYGLALTADHRPEASTRHAAVGAQKVSASASFPLAPRPLWLLPAPQLLLECQGRPHCDGPLTLLAGPERIESGWWDQGEAGPGDLRRDYYVALAADQRWLWIYRDWHSPGGWFLHGVFA